MEHAKLLLIVDVQKGFITNTDIRAILPNVQMLARHWQEQGWPIVASRFVNVPRSNWVRLRDWHEMMHEPDTQLASELTLETPYVFKKSTYNAWSDEVSAVAAAYEVRDVVIAGVDTNECVLATAIGVFDAGFRPIVVQDACASSGGSQSHRMAVELLSALIGKAQLQLTQSLVD